MAPFSHREQSMVKSNGGEDGQDSIFVNPSTAFRILLPSGPRGAAAQQWRRSDAVSSLNTTD